MAENKKTEVAVRKEFARVENIQPLFDTDRFEHMQRSAQALMHSTVLPDAIRGKTPSECFSNLIVACDIAMTYDLPLLSVVQNMNPIHGKILFTGQMVSSMLQSRLGVRLYYHYTGERGTTEYRVYVWDQDFSTLTDEQVEALAPGKYPRGARMIDGSVGDWQTFGKNNAPMKQWTGTAQRNQLAYRGAREWARLYEPGHLLGVYSEDEFDYYEERTRRSAQAPATIPAISASFVDEAEMPAKDISADEDEGVPGGEPDHPDGEAAGNEEPAGELDLSEGEVVEDSPFDPVDGDEADDDEIGETGPNPDEDEPGDDQPPFDTDEADSDEPVESEGEPDLQSEADPDEPEGEPAVTMAELDALREYDTYSGARAAWLEISRGKRFRGSEDDAAEAAREAVYAILAARPDAPGPAEDVVLFRLWLAIADDPDDLEDTWTEVQKTEQYLAQKPGGKEQLKTAVQLCYQKFSPGG